MAPMFRRILVVSCMALAAGIGGVALGNFVGDGLAGRARTGLLTEGPEPELGYNELDYTGPNYGAMVVVPPRMIGSGNAPAFYDCEGCDSHVPSLYGWVDDFVPFESGPLPPYDPELDDPLVDWPDMSDTILESPTVMSPPVLTGSEQASAAQASSAQVSSAQASLVEAGLALTSPTDENGANAAGTGMTGPPEGAELASDNGRLISRGEVGEGTPHVLPDARAGDDRDSVP